MNDRPDIHARVRRTLEAYSMLPANAPVLVMVSGGGDSVALLRLLAVEGISEAHVSALHVDHGLRGDDSAADAEFVSLLCEDLGVPCVTERVDVAAIARRDGLNLEDAGRRERYRIAEARLDVICSERNVDPASGRIATAHTRDDRIETFVMRLVQGAGATGLTSLRPVRGRVIRPLLGVSRDDLRGYLDASDQEWREDETNADVERVRAKVRHELLPLMREINPRADEAIARAIELLADEDDLLVGMAEAFAADFVETTVDEVRFYRPMLETLSRPMRRRTVRSALLGTFPEASRLEFDHLEALVDGLGEEGFARDLPEGLRAYSEYGRMVVSRGGEVTQPLAPCLLDCPGVVDLGESGTMRIESAVPGDVADDTHVAVIDADSVEGQLRVGSVREGDRMRPLGMTGSKKVSDLFVDAKVPRRRRPGVPIVRDGDRIVWVAGVRMAEEYKVTSGTRRALRLEWRERGSGQDAC